MFQLNYRSCRYRLQKGRPPPVKPTNQEVGNKHPTGNADTLLLQSVIQFREVFRLIDKTKA